MPTFTLIEEEFRGNTIVEILKDGEPFWENLAGAGRHFSFGQLKASAILRCMAVIERFVDTDGKYPSDGYYVEVQDPFLKRVYHVSCERSFCTTSGRLVCSPYLDIRKPDCERLVKFGLLKATALLELKDEIEGFVSSRC